MDPLSVVAHLARTWQRHGTAGVWLIMRERLRPDTRVLVLLGLGQPPPPPELEPNGGIDHRFASRAEVAGLPLEVGVAGSLAAFDRGDRCLLQTIDQRLAGVVWVSTALEVELYWGVRLNLPGDVVYTFRTWTHPAYRGRGLQGHRHLAVLSAVRGSGRSRLLCFAANTNLASLRGAHKSGCRPIGTVRMRRSGDPRPRITIESPAWSGVTLASL